MKRFLPYLLLCGLIMTHSGCKKNKTEPLQTEADLKLSRSRLVANIIDPNDPNLNASWDWTAYVPHHLYYSPTGSITNVQIIDTFLPFYTQGNVLNTGAELDIFPEDGWVLAFKDFGTPTRPIDFPFFVLYNKYRGIFRAMLYNAQQTPSSYLKGELSFVNPANSGALMTFNAEGDAAFSNSYDHSVKDNQVATSNQYSDWIVFDFNLSGYDPDYSPNTGLKLQITRVDETTLSLNSTAFTLQESVTNATPGGQGSAFATAINTGYNITNSANDLRKVMKDSNYGKESGDIFYNVLNSSYVQLVPYLSTALGIVRTFLGGQSKPAPRQPLKLNGTLNFTGLATLGNALYSRTFSLSAASNVLSDYKPVQPINWGIFNIRTKPAFNYHLTQGYNDACQWYVDATVESAVPIDFISNHSANGMTLSYATAGIIVDALDTANPTRFGNNFPYHQETRQFTYGMTLENTYQGREIAVKLYYHINSPTKYMDRDIVIYKVYPASYNYTGTFRVDTCPNPGGPGIEW